MDASEIYSERLNAKEVTFPKKNGKLMFPAADERITLSGRDQELRTSTLIREHPIRGEDQRDVPGESEGSPPPQPQDSYRRVVLRAENFGDLITADHKVLNEGGESRNNHRKAVVEQDLATPWIQSYPCQTKTSQETERSLRKFLESSEKPGVISSDTSLEFGKSCKNYHGSFYIRTLHRCETNGIPEREVRRILKKNFCCAVTIRSGRKMVDGFHGTLSLSAKRSRPLGRWENTV